MIVNNSNPLFKIIDDSTIAFSSDEKNRPPISHLSKDLFPRILKFLDKKEYTVLEQVCKKMFQIVHNDPQWEQYLLDVNIKPIQNRMRFQALNHAKQYCSFLFPKILKDYEGIKELQKQLNVELNGFEAEALLTLRGENIIGLKKLNVFEAKALIESKISTKTLEEWCHNLIQKMNTLSYKIVRTENSAMKSELQGFEQELLLYPMCGISIEASRKLIHEGAISEATLMQAFKKISNFTFSEINAAIKHSYSRDLILMMLQNSVTLNSNQVSNLLSLSLQHRLDEGIILFLLEGNACSSEHLEIALWNGYSETLINRMYEQLMNAPFKNEENRLIHGAFYGAASQGGKVIGETVLTYSEELICKILDKIEKIEPRYLEAALDRKFAESNIEKFIEKVEKITCRELRVAIQMPVSEKLLKIMIGKLIQVDATIIWSAFKYSEEVFQMLLAKNAPMDNNVLDAALEERKSEGLIKTLISKLNAVEGYTITLAKEKGYSQNIITLLKAKCPNPPQECIIS